MTLWVIYGKLDIDKDLEILEKFNLDANEWYLIRCLFLSKYEGLNEYLVNFVTKSLPKGKMREMLTELKKKNIVSKKYKVPKEGESFLIADFEFHEPFINKYFKTSNEMGRELFDAYPSYLVMDNGVHLPAKNLASKIVFKEQNDFFIFYCKQIKYSVEKHEEIMESLKWAIEHDLVRSSIVEYVVSEKYNDHIQTMKDGSNSPFVRRFNNVRVI